MTATAGSFIINLMFISQLIEDEMRYEYDARYDDLHERYAATAADMDAFNLSEEECRERDAFEADVKAGFEGDFEDWRAKNVIDYLSRLKIEAPLPPAVPGDDECPF